MNEFVTQTLPRTLSEFSPLAYILVFVGGMLTSLEPCNLSMAPVVIAYVGGTAEPTRMRGLSISTAFTLGSSTTFALLGILVSGVGRAAGPGRSTLYYIVAAVCFIVALNLLGVLRLNLSLSGMVKINRILRPGHLGAYILGSVVGVAGSQCGMPVLIAILSIVMAKGQIAYGASLLFVYGLGRGVPIIAAGTFTGVLKTLPALAKFTPYAEKAAGLVLLALGFVFLWKA